MVLYYKEGVNPLKDTNALHQVIRSTDVLGRVIG